MQIPKTGLSEDSVFETLRAYRDKDMDWREGRTWALVYDVGHDVQRVAEKAYVEFLWENALDPTVFPSLMRMENDLVDMCAHHLKGGPDVVGNYTSGGTESCMLSVKTARDHARATKGITAPEIVMPSTAHAAFHKGAEYFGLKKVVVDVDTATWKADVDAMRAAITPNTVLLVGSATSYAHGVVDPIEELGQLALEHDLLFHVDGCIGGFILPYLRRLGADIPPFEFDVPGVTSISMDLHKYAYCAKGASVLLWKNGDLRKHQIFSCANWTGYTVVNPTMQSTKSGGPIAAAWAVMNYVGDDRYLELARITLEGTRRIVDGINAIDGLAVMGDPAMNLVAFQSTDPALSIYRVIDLMKKKDWYIQPQLGFCGSIANAHLSINPDRVRWADEMLADLEECVATARAAGWEGPPAGIAQALAGVDPATIDAETFQSVLAMAGMNNGVELPDEMAEINELLDALPPAFTEVMLKEFLNQLYVR